MVFKALRCSRRERAEATENDKMQEIWGGGRLEEQETRSSVAFVCGRDGGQTTANGSFPLSLFALNGIAFRLTLLKYGISSTPSNASSMRGHTNRNIANLVQIQNKRGPKQSNPVLFNKIHVTKCVCVCARASSKHRRY